MSAELIWALVKNNNSFLVKRSGVEFSSEANNLTNLNSFKYSGLADAKSVGIQPNAKGGVIVSVAKAKKAQYPAKAFSVVKINKTRRNTAKSVARLIARNAGRPDLLPAGLVRASAILSSQQPKKVKAQRPAKGIRAQKAAAKAQA